MIPTIDPRRIFIDTSAIIAMFNEKDKYYQEAKSYIYSLVKNKYGLITTNTVLIETFNFFKRKSNKFESSRICPSIKDSSLFSIFYSDEAIEKEAFKIFIKYNDQRFSFTDCISFAFMEKHEIDQAFTFDDDFKIFGFKVNPELRSSL
jgi:hypothetical protein